MKQIVGIGVSALQPDGTMGDRKFYYSQCYVEEEVRNLVTQLIEAQKSGPVPDPNLGPAANIFGVLSTIVEDVP